MTEYKNRTAVIIGGTHGVGRAAVELLIAGGAKVLLTGLNPKNIESARTELGSRARVVRSDIADLKEIAALAETVRSELGAIDFLFINAGIGGFAPFAGITEAEFDRFFAINTKGPFFTAQKLSPLMRPGGAIVFTTVTLGVGTPTLSVYSGTKAALRAFTKVLAAELLEQQVRVNAVAPGFIDTPTLGVADATPEERAALSKLGDEITPMKRHATPEEVARAALFLGFDATFTTGAELLVDGGLSEVEAA